jgi:hypothetical protein
MPVINARVAMACSLARFCRQVILKRSEAHSEVTVVAARLVAPNVGWIARHLLSRGVLEGDRRDQSWMGRLKIAPSRAYCRVATGHGSGRGAADLLQNAV